MFTAIAGCVKNVSNVLYWSSSISEALSSETWPAMALHVDQEALRAFVTYDMVFLQPVLFLK